MHNDYGHGCYTMENEPIQQSKGKAILATVLFVLVTGGFCVWAAMEWLP